MRSARGGYNFCKHGTFISQSSELLGTVPDNQERATMRIDSLLKCKHLPRNSGVIVMTVMPVLLCSTMTTWDSASPPNLLCDMVGN